MSWHHHIHVPGLLAMFCIIIVAGVAIGGLLRKPPDFLTPVVAALVIVIILSLSGCAALQRTDERVWQTLHVVDAIQTDRIVADQCYEEGHPLTRAFIGAEPTHARVAAWAIGGAALHAGITELLIDHDLNRTADVWELVSLADTGVSIEQTWHVGVRIGAPNTRQPENGCRP
jgi:hypothetical protein